MNSNLNKQEASKGDKNLKDAPMPPLPFAKHVIEKGEEKKRRKEVEEIAKKEGNLTLDEAKKLLVDLEAKGGEIKRRLDELFRLRGVTSDYLQQYINNPNNFTVEEWERLHKERRKLVDSLNLPSDLAELGERFAPGQPNSAPARGQTRSIAKPKERRAKSSAAQRRGWLPMR